MYHKLKQRYVLTWCVIGNVIGLLGKSMKLIITPFAANTALKSVWFMFHRLGLGRLERLACRTSSPTTSATSVPTRLRGACCPYVAPSSSVLHEVKLDPREFTGDVSRAGMGVQPDQVVRCVILVRPQPDMSSSVAVISRRKYAVRHYSVEVVSVCILGLLPLVPQSGLRSRRKSKGPPQPTFVFLPSRACVADSTSRPTAGS
jgi:hypothetical protein